LLSPNLILHITVENFSAKTHSINFVLNSGMVLSRLNQECFHNLTAVIFIHYKSECFKLDFSKRYAICGVGLEILCKRGVVKSRMST
jgi:hypothetical protein